MNIAGAAVLGLVLLVGPALAQNSELAILADFSRVKWNFGAVSRTEYRIGLQGSYAWQLLERKAGRLYLELPVSSFAPPVGQGVITDIGGANEIAVPRSVIFVTPGLRNHINVKPRLAVYGALGAGVAIRQQRVSITRPVPETPGAVERLYSVNSWRGSPAFDIAGGVAFRLTRLLSLRGELRAFRTTSVPGFGTGRNYPSAHAGLGFHF